MAAASRLAGYSFGQADLLRRAMGKKDKEKMAKERDKFIEGCARDEQHPGEKGERDFRFAGEICRLRIQQEPQRGLRVDQLSDGVFEGELSGRIHGRIVEQRNRQHRQDFDLRRRMQTDGHPDPAAGRESERLEVRAGRTCEPKRRSRLGYNAIRYGLAAIKNVGEGAMEAAIRRARGERRIHFARRFLPAARFTHRQSQNAGEPGQSAARLISSGAIAPNCSPASRNRWPLRPPRIAIAPAVRFRSSTSCRRRSRNRARARIFTPWTEREKMFFEKELLGFYVTGHPLDDYMQHFRDGKYQTIASLGELADRATFRIAGAIVQVDKKFTKKEGKPFAVVWLEDMTGTSRSCSGTKFT